jgi:hypothetical protein
MKVMISAGGTGWIEDGANEPKVITFREDTWVEVQPSNPYWYRVTEKIPGLPETQSSVLINSLHIPSLRGARS